MKSLKRMLYELTMDKDFVALKFLIDRPNVFHVAGATHLETWHSRFLSWLLNPNERHMLGYYPFQRFLMIVAQSADENMDDLTDLAMLNVSQFRNPEVIAEKDINKLEVFEQEDERAVNDDKGRLDVFFKVNIADEAQLYEQRLIMAVEQKVYAPVDQQQCEKYLRKFEQTYKGEKYLLVALVPKNQMKETNELTFGSSKWIGVDYQQLVDDVLMPCLANPDLNTYAKSIIEQYVDALRMPYKNERKKLATIEEERVLVRSIYDRFEDVIQAISIISADQANEEYSYVKKVVTDTYGDVFRTIHWVLNEENDIETLWSFHSSFQRTVIKRWDELHVIVTYNGEKIELKASSLIQLWTKVLNWIEDQNLPLHAIIEEGFILGKGDKGDRYAIALQAVHKDRRKFTTPKEYVSTITGETYYLELKINPQSGMQTIAKLFTKLGVEIEMPLLDSVGIS